MARHRLKRRYGRAEGDTIPIRSRRQLRKHYGLGYGFTVIVPYVEHGATEWHPTDRNFAPLSRGFFRTKHEAHKWAKEHLGPGASYSIRRLGRF